MKRRTRERTGTLSDAVTQRELDNRALAREAAAEGFVLLKNENKALPLAKGSKIGLYGAGAVCTVKGGTGSGDVNERDSINIYDGLKNAGFQVTSASWLEAYNKVYDEARLAWRDLILSRINGGNTSFIEAYFTTKFIQPDGPDIGAAAKGDGADVAVYVIRRIAGEGADRRDEAGDYFISEGEKALLAQVCEAYKQVVLVLNTGGLIDLAFTEEFSNIDAIVQYVQAGQEGGNALADILVGDVTPSGKMTDTWALTYGDYPNADFFSYKSGDVFCEEYREGIYVGYRYFDTFEVPVRYCFGHGLSYTTFDMNAVDISITGQGTKNVKLQVTAAIKNTGDTYAGKEVMQVYVSCPQGKLPKEFRRLVGFGKTKLLAPGEEQTMTISVAIDQLTSYCEESAAWIMEAGAYGIWIGSSLDSAKLAGSVRLDADAVTSKLRNICPIEGKLEEFRPEAGKLQAREAAWHKDAEALPVVVLKSADIVTETVTYSAVPDDLPGEAGEIVEKLSLDQLVAFATGDPSMGQGSTIGAAGQSVPGAAAETVKAAEGEPWNVASIVLADGPAGLRLHRDYQVENGQVVKKSFIQTHEDGLFVGEAEKAEKKGETYYQFCTAIPVGTLLAQTWNTELVCRIGEMIGHEMEEFEVTLWLAPGMNIHRNPLCGRNFEYYSEDPLVSGIMASAITLGVQKVPGCGTTIKHFACNNLEDNRKGSDSVIHERALREIYLKGFEIAVKNAQPMSIMTSYNLINGVHAANSYDLCSAAARDEWGFAGAIMTDWTTTTSSTAGICTASGCMRAGNDMVMPGNPSDHENIREELACGTLDIRELKRCVWNTIRIILQSNQYEDAVSYLNQFAGSDTYMTAR